MTRGFVLSMLLCALGLACAGDRTDSAGDPWQPFPGTASGAMCVPGPPLTVEMWVGGGSFVAVGTIESYRFYDEPLLTGGVPAEPIAPEDCERIATGFRIELADVRYLLGEGPGPELSIAFGAQNLSDWFPWPWIEEGLPTPGQVIGCVFFATTLDGAYTPTDRQIFQVFPNGTVRFQNERQSENCPLWRPEDIPLGLSIDELAARLSEVDLGTPWAGWRTDHDVAAICDDVREDPEGSGAAAVE